MIQRPKKMNMSHPELLKKKKKKTQQTEDEYGLKIDENKNM